MPQVNDDDIICCVYAKGEARYVWLYTDRTTLEVYRSIGRFAADPKLDFDWDDCRKVICQLKTMEPTPITNRIANHFDNG